MLATLLIAIVPLAVVEEIVAKVNGDVITRSELDGDGRSGDALRDRIDRLLLLQKARELGLNVDREVSRELAAQQVETRVSDPDAFQALVRQQTGLSYADYREGLHERLLIQQAVRELAGRQIVIPRAEIEKHYEDHKRDFVREERIFLREILLSTVGKSEPVIAAKAKELSVRARKGESFAELARLHSDSSTRHQGGEFGTGFKKGDLVGGIEEAVWTREPGSVTDPIRVSAGFVILRIEDKHKAGLASIENVQNEITERLYVAKLQPALRALLTRLRQEAFLEIKAGYIDSGAAPGKNTAWTELASLKPETVTKQELQRRERPVGTSTSK